MSPTPRTRIAVVGLGYVGLPLAVALARHFPVTGYDADPGRIAELKAGHDRTREIPGAALKGSALALSDDPAAMAGCELFIVAVPTPVDDHNLPDLGALRSACRTVGAHMAKGAIVCFESTVYPGVTESICGPDLEAYSRLVCGKEFFLGYSPERINPGDREHTVDRITKVVAGQTPEVTAKLAEVYGAVTTGGVFVAKDIRTAEAAKVIENAQRDINIAFINEIAVIFQKLGLSVFDVLDASATKWNFLNFKPGLVGGHCIGVDPYYLAFRAQEVGHQPEVILAGRRINDRMGHFVAERIADFLALQKRDGPPGRVLVLGFTFKEDVPDLRNSKVVDIVKTLRTRGHIVDIVDPHADAGEAKLHYGIVLKPEPGTGERYACVVGAVAHTEFRTMDSAALGALLEPGGLLADVKGMWRAVDLPAGTNRWTL
jgi:UDP-N-acetyl-D-glucosamine/UDP-N-acetyl-D-galactosamine dehydrogenase